ncbi:MAG: SUMF1/EgtB/PvdO family nonheme iron enzyme [Chlorobiaceae bacterium]|nr:SUMF1/EgtB/PvdO family nonheme iron enzyme [Chlorobiaceae bacterium]
MRFWERKISALFGVVILFFVLFIPLSLDNIVVQLSGGVDSRSVIAAPYVLCYSDNVKVMKEENDKIGVQKTTVGLESDAISFFSIKYWTAQSLVAIFGCLVSVGGLFFAWYQHWGKTFFFIKKKLKKYRSFISEDLGWISMPGLPGGVENIRVGLNDGTFVQLHFVESINIVDLPSEADKFQNSASDEHTPDEIVQRAFNNDRRMLLVIGDSGAGKTTLLQYYAFCALDRRRCRRLGFNRRPQVFYFPLRLLVITENLSENLARYAKQCQLDIDAFLFDKWLQKKSFVLFDGLDEISDHEAREAACKWIDRSLTTMLDGYFVVTSRRSGYGVDSLKKYDIRLMSSHKRADVLDFSVEQQEDFLHRWFEAAYLLDDKENNIDISAWKKAQKEKAKNKSEQIITALKDEKNRGLRQLAGIPMILQLMALLWKKNGFLPSGRIDLYGSALDYMLQLRDKSKDIKSPLTAGQSRLVLTPIAWWMQNDLQKDEASKKDMINKMEPELSSLADRQFTPPAAKEFCENLVKRAALLSETSTNYMFRHKSFREYLASIEWIKRCRRTGGYIDMIVNVFGEDWWSEPLRFFFAQSDAEIFDLFMGKLIEGVRDQPLPPKKTLLLGYIIDEAPQKKVSSLCEKLLDPDTTEICQRLILDCLFSIGQVEAYDSIKIFKSQCHNKNYDIASRAEEVLLTLDPENRKTDHLQYSNSLLDHPKSFRNIIENQAEYILVDAGSFACELTGKHEYVKGYYMSKYLVTNRRYRLFINYLHTGIHPNIQKKIDLDFLNYSIEMLAQESQIKGLIDTIKKQKNLSNYLQSRFDGDRKFGGDEHPVVGVTWFGARAYCLWLSMLESNGVEKEIYRLPTEIEWEYAAMGKSGRRYPWGDKPPTSQRANYGDIFGTTTPVGRCPAGASPEGINDLAGNVWEWMDDWYKINEKSAKSLRGGSWHSSPESLRCGSRDFYHPVLRSPFHGFRVVRGNIP